LKRSARESRLKLETSLDVLFCLFGNRKQSHPEDIGPLRVFGSITAGIPTSELSRGTSHSLLFAGRCYFPLHERDIPLLSNVG
jgi:hypothetical protein